VDNSAFGSAPASEPSVARLIVAIMTTDSTGPDPARPPIEGWPDLVTVALGLSTVEVRELCRFLTGALAARACAGLFREIGRWAGMRGSPPDPLERGLRALGARCDCEALEVLARG